MLAGIGAFHKRPPERLFVSKSDNAPFHVRLRDETRVQHIAIENNALMKKVFAADVAMNDYVVLLKQYYRFVRPLEKRAFACTEWNDRTWSFPPRPHADLLEDDLRALDHPIPVLTGEVDLFLPLIKTFAEALGCVYVLEGAAHGSAFLSRRLQESLKLTPEQGLSYYNRYGNKLGAFWHEFRGVMDEVSSDEQKADQIIESARQTFEQLDGWLKRPQVGGDCL